MLLGNRLGLSETKDNGLTHVKYKNGTKQDFNVTTISADTIPNIRDVEEIDFGVGVVSIADQAFRSPNVYDYTLKSVKFDRCVNLTTIGASAFNNCRGLNSNLDFRKCVRLQAIAANCFTGTGDIQVAYMPVFSGNAFGDSNIRKIIYYGQTKVTVDRAVTGNELTYVDLSDVTRFSWSSTYNNKGVFQNCPKLETIVLNPNLQGMNVTGGLCSGGSYTIDFTNTQMSNFATYAFNNNFTGTVKLSKNVLTNFGRNCIYNCGDIKIEFPKGHLNYNFIREGVTNQSSYNSTVTFVVDPSDIATLLRDDVKITDEDARRKFFVKDSTTTTIKLYKSETEYEELTVPVSLRQNDIPQSKLTDSRYVKLDLTGVKYLNYKCLENCVIPVINCPNVEYLGRQFLNNSTTNTIQNLNNIRYTSSDPFNTNKGIVNFDWFNNCEHPEKFEFSAKSMFAKVTNLQSVSIPNFDSSKITFNYVFAGSLNLRTIKLPWMQCPTGLINSSNTFGSSTSSYTGYNTRTQGVNKLIVPVGATGYDEMITAHPELTDTTMCGFTLQYGD